MRAVKFPSAAGIAPLKSLLLRFRATKLVKLPSSVGIDPAQLIAVETQGHDVGQAPQLRRDSAAQLIVAENQMREAGHAPQLRRDRPAQIIAVVDTKLQPEAGQAPQLRRDRPGQLIVAEIQVRGGWSSSPAAVGSAPLNPLLLRARKSRLVKLPSSAGSAPLKSLSLRDRCVRAGQAPQLCRDRPAQRIVVENQVREGGQAPQLRRDRPAQIIVVERQAREGGQAPQLPSGAPRSTHCWPRSSVVTRPSAFVVTPRQFPIGSVTLNQLVVVPSSSGRPLRCTAPPAPPGPPPTALSVMVRVAEPEVRPVAAPVSTTVSSPSYEDVLGGVEREGRRAAGGVRRDRDREVAHRRVVHPRGRRAARDADRHRPSPSAASCCRARRSR